MFDLPRQPGLRITDYRTYGPDRPEGFIVEAVMGYNDKTLEPWYALPAWDEWNYPEFCQVFPTVEAARAAVIEAGLERDI